MKRLSLLSAVFAAAAIGASFLAASCETESAGGNSLSISPSEATIGIKQSITLKARGAETYSWSLSNKEIGRLSNTTGSTTTYTALSGVGEDQIVSVTASTTSGGSSDTTYYSQDTTNETNTATVSSTGRTAVIRHR